MSRSEYRWKIENALDDIEGDVNKILITLKEVKEMTEWDAEAFSAEDIEKLQIAVNDAIKELDVLADKLY